MANPDLDAIIANLLSAIAKMDSAALKLQMAVDDLAALEGEKAHEREHGDDERKSSQGH